MNLALKLRGKIPYHYLILASGVGKINVFEFNLAE
jgi:hypothetical protein